MISLLFSLFLIAMIATMVNKRIFSLATFSVALILTLYWFNYHATDSLDIMFSLTVGFRNVINFQI